MNEQIHRIESQLELNAEYYSVTDPTNLTLAVFAKAALVALHDKKDSGLRSMVEHLVEVRDDIDAPLAVKLLERGYQADLLQYDESYPRGYQNEEAWLKTFAEVNVDRDLLRWGVVANNISLRPLQSNIAERYKTIKLLAALTADRFNKPLSHLDIGSSVMHGDYKLLYEADPHSPVIPFKEIEIVHPESLAEDDRLTSLANVALRESVSFGHVMGVDITDIRDHGVKRWAKSCSFYPDELLSQEGVADYEALDKLDPDYKRAHFYQGNFAELDRRKFLNAAPVDQWDVITFSTIFYQVSKQERLAMLVNATSLLSENGMIVIQDARDGNFSKPFNYTTSVIDALARRSSPEESLLVWENGRCQRARVGTSTLTIDDLPHRLNEALEIRFGNAI